MSVPDLDCGRLGPYAYRLVLTAIATRDAAGPFQQESIIAAEGCLDAPSLVPLGGSVKVQTGRYPVVHQFLDRDKPN